jgi:circadian clock protein KaiB
MSSAAKKGAKASQGDVKRKVRKAAARGGKKKGRGAKNATEEFENALKKLPKQHYVLRLFVTGTTERSQAAITNIRKFCELYLQGHYELEVVDIYQQPEQTRLEQIIAAPTLVKKLPFPLRKMVGDFSDDARVLVLIGSKQKAKKASE